jgi:hypothetical protein
MTVTQWHHLHLCTYTTGSVDVAASSDHALLVCMRALCTCILVLLVLIPTGERSNGSVKPVKTEPFFTAVFCVAIVYTLKTELWVAYAEIQSCADTRRRSAHDQVITGADSIDGALKVVCYKNKYYVHYFANVPIMPVSIIQQQHHESPVVRNADAQDERLPAHVRLLILVSYENCSTAYCAERTTTHLVYY